MKDIVKSVSKLSVPTVINLISSLIKNKLIALLIGPAGLGIYSQFLNISGLFTTVLPVGSMGLVRYISNMYSEKKYSEINYLVKYFLLRNFILSIVISILLVFFSNDISSLLFSTYEYSDLVKLFAVVLPVTLVYNLVDIYLKSIRTINKYVLLLSLNSIISTFLTIPLIYKWDITGAVLAILFSAISNLVTGIIILKKYNLVDISLKYEKVSKDIIKNIYGLGIAVLISMVLQNVTILAIKGILANLMGLNSVGIFQCVYSISSSYFGVFFVVIGTYSIPKISSMNENSEIVVEMNSTYRFLLMVYLPILVVVFSLRSFLIPLLYSKEFTSASELLIYQLPAELFRALSWTAGLWLIPKLYFSKWLIFETIFYSLFFFIFIGLVYYFNIGVIAASASYLFAYIIFFFVNHFSANNIIKFKFSKSVIKQFIITFSLIVFSFSVSIYNEFYGYFAALISLLFWIIFSLNKTELLKVKSVILKQK